MKAWYMSQNRFKNKIIKQWEKQGFKYNYGHIQLLSFSYNTLMFWEREKKNKISQKNKQVVHPTLF